MRGTAYNYWCPSPGSNMPKPYTSFSLLCMVLFSSLIFASGSLCFGQLKVRLMLYR